MIYIGKFTVDIPANTQLFIDAQAPFSCIVVDEDDEPRYFLGASVNNQWKGIVREDIKISVEIDEYMHSSLDARPVRPPHEEVSNVPVEVQLEKPPVTLQDSIKSFCAQLVQHEFGRDSEEVDTFEEMMDYDIPDDDDWQYEAKEVVPDETFEPVEDPPPAEDPPADPPPAEDPPADPRPAEDPPS